MQAHADVSVGLIDISAYLIYYILVKGKEPQNVLFVLQKQFGKPDIPALHYKVAMAQHLLFQCGVVDIG